MPTCPRCGNEEDLREWLDGRTYCRSCIQCPHGTDVADDVCTDCVRLLHTVMTFEGPRIADVEYYVAEAWREYSVPPGNLQAWNYAETDELENVTVRTPQGWGARSHGVSAPPPHHRLTSSGGSR